MSATGASAIATTKVGRNDPCPCGSGKKFKHCCQGKDARAELPPGTGEASRPSPALTHGLQALVHAAKEHLAAERWADAIASLHRIVRLNPNSAEAHHDLGVACLRCGRLASAAESLRRAVELRPGFASALRNLALALEQGGQDAEAVRAYLKLSRIADDPLERLHFSAKALTMEGKPAEAEQEFRRLLVLSPRHAATWVLLGQPMANRGIFEEAARCFTQAIEGVPAAFQQLASVKRMTEADRLLLDHMRIRAERPDLDAGSRAGVHFGLGKAFDDLGDYAEAMRHYETGNRLRGASTPLDRAALIAQFDNIIAIFTAERLSGARRSLARPAQPGDDTPVLIVGMPRSGTTLVEQILSSHPAIVAGGELPFLEASEQRGCRAFAIGAVRRPRWPRSPKTIARNCAKSAPRRCGSPTSRRAISRCSG